MSLAGACLAGAQLPRRPRVWRWYEQHSCPELTEDSKDENPIYQRDQLLLRHKQAHAWPVTLLSDALLKFTKTLIILSNFVYHGPDLICIFRCASISWKDSESYSPYNFSWDIIRAWGQQDKWTIGLQDYNLTTVQPCNLTTLQLYNFTTLQLYNLKTSQLSNIKALQPYNHTHFQH